MNFYRIHKEVNAIDLEAGMIITITGYQPGYIPSRHGRRTIKEFPVSMGIMEGSTFDKVNVKMLHDWRGWDGDIYRDGYTCSLGRDFFDSVIMEERVI